MDKLLKNLQKFIELRKAIEDIKKSEKPFKMSPPKMMSAGNPVATGPKSTVTATSSTGGMGRRGGSKIRETTSWKAPSGLGKNSEKGVHTGFKPKQGQSHAGNLISRGNKEAKNPSKQMLSDSLKGRGKDEHERVLSEIKKQPKPNLPKTEKMEKKQKALIRPDVVSTPELFNEPPMVSRPGVVSGPTMMNVRKKGPVDGKFANPIDMGEIVATDGIRMSEKDGDQKYHIYDGKMRITSNPMTLKEINAKHGPTQRIESSGLRVIPHQPQPATPQKLRRSSSEE